MGIESYQVISISILTIFLTFQSLTFPQSIGNACFTSTKDDSTNSYNGTMHDKDISHVAVNELYELHLRTKNNCINKVIKNENFKC